MTKISSEIVAALFKTANRLQKTTSYQWGHMGSCNCGFLAQEITSLNRNEIHSRAMERPGDWTEQLNDYCPSSGQKMDDLIDILISFGFTPEDLKHLERLSDPRILRTFPLQERNLKHNVKNDVVKYINAWALHIENELVEEISINDIRIYVAGEENATRNLLEYSSD